MEVDGLDGRALVLALAGTDRDGAFLHFLVAHDEHVGDLLHLGFPDFIADLLVAVVAGNPQPRVLEHLFQLPDTVLLFLGDGQDTDLFGGQPHGQGPGVLLDEQGQRPLVAAEGGAVDDVGVLLHPVPVHIFHAEPLGQLEVDLDGDESVLLAVDVFDLDIQLGAVEGGLAVGLGVIDL